MDKFLYFLLYIIILVVLIAIAIPIIGTILGILLVFFGSCYDDFTGSHDFFMCWFSLFLHFFAPYIWSLQIKCLPLHEK